MVSLLNRLAAFLEGEVSTESLEAYRRAGLIVYDLLRAVEERRLACKIEGLDPWSVAPATQAEALCTWNAFVLQMVGDQFLDADARMNPATAGFVPRVTAAQVQTVYGQVEAWVSRARQAHSNPESALDVAVPADLPPWVAVEPCPPAHLEATLEAARAIRSHAEAALAVFQEEALPEDKRPAAQRLRQLAAGATAPLEYAERLWSSHPPRSIHEDIERHAHRAVESYYHLGQLLAMPRLVDGYDPARALAGTGPSAAPVSGGARLPRPGEPGFDPWCLTDPSARAGWQADPSARRAIRTLWANDPDPARTLAIQEQIDAALARGDIAYAETRDGRRLGHYYCCPWAPIYVVKRPVDIGGRRLRALQEFTFDVSAEQVARGGRFQRELLVGSFQPTDQVDYCDLSTGGHAD